jgi:hypothetical protein
MAAVIGRDRASGQPWLAALAWLTGAVSVAGCVAAWVLAARNRDLFDISTGFSPDRFLAAYALVGAVVASRRPANPIGWFLLGIGLVIACRAAAGEYALHALAGSSRPSSGLWAAWFVSWSLPLVFPCGLLMFLLLLFPNGRPIAPRWWAVGWLGAGLGIFYVLISWLYPGLTQVSGLPGVPNPTGIRGWTVLNPNGLAGSIFWLLGGVCLIAAAVSVFVRYRRSADEERLQLKWFAYAAVVSLALLLVLLPASIVTKTGGVVWDLALVTGIGLALPVAIGIAILKYRLYAINKIISRTLAYAIVTGLLVGVYAGLVLLATQVLKFHSAVAVAASTLAAAALFNPLRLRVQAVVDRHFDRVRYDAERVVGQFAVQLREQVDLDVLGHDLLGVVNQVLGPAHLALWLSDTADTSTVNLGAGQNVPGPSSAVREPRVAESSRI